MAPPPCSSMPTGTYARRRSWKDVSPGRGGDRSAASRVRPVLVEDGDQEQRIGEKQEQVDGARRLVRLPHDRHREPAQADQPERGREKPEEPVVRPAPEPQEEESDLPAQRPDHPVGEVGERERAHRDSFTSARTSTATPIKAGSERTATRLMSGRTKTSRMRPTSLSATPPKHMAAERRSVDGWRRWALRSRTQHASPIRTERT